MTVCAMFGCKNRRHKGCGKHFFRFPMKDPERLIKWIEATQRDNWKPSIHSKVCSDHFTERDYMIRPGAAFPYLRIDAVPSPLHADQRKKKTKKRNYTKKVASETAEPMEIKTEDVEQEISSEYGCSYRKESGTQTAAQVEKTQKVVETRVIKSEDESKDEEHGVVETQGEEHGVVEMQGEEYGLVEMQGEEHGALEMQGEEHGAMEMQGEEHMDAEMQGEEHGAMEMQGEEHMDAEMQGEEHMAAEMQGKEHIAAEMQGEEQGAVKAQGEEHRAAEVQGKEHGAAEVQGKVRGVAEVQGEEHGVAERKEWPVEAQGEEHRAAEVQGEEKRAAEAQDKEHEVAEMRGEKHRAAEEKEHGVAEAQGEEHGAVEVQGEEHRAAEAQDEGAAEAQQVEVQDDKQLVDSQHGKQMVKAQGKQPVESQAMEVQGEEERHGDMHMGKAQRKQNMDVHTQDKKEVTEEQEGKRAGETQNKRREEEIQDKEQAVVSPEKVSVEGTECEMLGVIGQGEKMNVGGQAEGPAVGEQAEGPAVGEQAEGPAVGEQAEGPAVGGQAESPALGRQAEDPAVECQDANMESPSLNDQPDVAERPAECKRATTKQPARKPTVNGQGRNRRAGALTGSRLPDLTIVVNQTVRNFPSRPPCENAADYIPVDHSYYTAFGDKENEVPAPVTDPKVVKLRKKIKTLQKQVLRQGVKIKSLKKSLVNLQKNNMMEIDPEQVVAEHCSGLTQVLFTQQLKNGCRRHSVTQYCSLMKEFALNLYCASPKAYKFCRLFLCLPHPVSLRNWKAAIEGNMGPSSEGSAPDNSSLGALFVGNEHLQDSPIQEVALQGQSIEERHLPETPIEMAHLPVMPMQEGHFSIIPGLEGHLSVVPVLEGHLSVVPVPEGHLSVVPVPEGHLSVDPVPEGHLSVDPVPEGHLSVDPVPEGHLSVDPVPEGHLSVDPVPEGHLSVVPVQNGDFSVIPVHKGHLQQSSVQEELQ